MKEKRTYRRFNLISFLAILGCIGMFLFECIFIFELYDRAVEQPEILQPVIETPLPAEVPSASTDVPPAQIKTAPASHEPVEPAAVPVG